MLKGWIKESGVSNEDIITIFKNIIFNRTLEELQRMVEGENKNKLPVIVVLGVSALLHDMRTGTLTATNTVLDRVIGKAAQQVILGTGDSVKLPSGPEERRALAEKLRSECDLGKPPSKSALADTEDSGKPSGNGKQ
jgi:hypothetical protein